jgi:simple sugar transport system ATP-binding protein
VYTPDEGEYLFDGRPREFSSPREALELGIATVYQDLAMIPLLSIWRNFFLGSEPTKGFWPFRRYNVKFAKDTSRGELQKMGIDIRDPEQPVGTLSGGERQSVAIARAVYFGAKVLILDEPTAALGVKQAGVVLRYIVQAKQRGVGVIFITHNPHHAYPVGDHFVILRRGQVFGDFAKQDIGLDHLVQMMAGGEELKNLAHELERAAGTAEGGYVDELTRAAAALDAEARTAEADVPAVSDAEVARADADATAADTPAAGDTAAEPSEARPQVPPSEARPPDDPKPGT